MGTATPVASHTRDSPRTATLGGGGIMSHKLGCLLQLTCIFRSAKILLQRILVGGLSYIYMLRGITMSQNHLINTVPDEDDRDC
jgi:hypothetical protein